MSKKATDILFDMIVGGGDGGGGGGITPSGSLSIVQNGTYDVTEKASAVVNVPNPSTGSLSINQNGEYDVTEKASVLAQVQGGVSVLSVPTGYTQKSGETIAEMVYNGYTVGGNIMIEFDTPPSQGDKVAVVGAISEGGVYCVYGTVNGDEVFGMYGVDIEGKSKADVDTMPNATINVNANGTVDVKGRNSAVVNVPNYGDIVETLKPATSGSGTVDLTDADMKSSVTKLRRNAFSGCYALRSIQNSRITELELSAFQDCSSLVSVNLSELSKIGSNAFASCKKLETVEIPKATSLGQQAFSNCTRLQWIHISGTSVATLSDTYVFINASGTMKIYVPDALVDAYKSASNWSTYASKIYPESEMPSA